MKKRLTEELPSSGSCECDHSWQVVEGGCADGQHLMMVCKKANCGATKLVEKPKMQESHNKKQILLG